MEGASRRREECGPRPQPGTIASMKKLLILAIIVALGVVAAKRLRPN